MRKRLLMGIGLSGIVLLTGCGNSSSTNAANSNNSTSTNKSNSTAKANITIAWWGGQQRADKINKVIQQFNQTHPNIKVTGQYMPFSGYFDKLNTELATGSAPDIFAMGSNINTYASKNVLLNLNPYVGKELDTSGIDKGLLTFNTFNGQLDGVPTGVNAYGMIADATLFKKAGVPLPKSDWTWADFKNVSAELESKLGKGYYAAYNSSGYNDTFQDWLLQRGKTIQTAKSNQVGFSVQDASQWFTYWDQLQKSGALVPPDLQTSDSPDSASTSLLTKGKVAMQFAPANELGQFQNVTKDNLVILPMPAGPQGHGVPLEASQDFVASAKTKYPSAVATFMSYFINNAQAVQTMGTDIGVPVTSAMRTALEKNATSSDKQLFTYVSEVAKDKVTPAYNILNFNQWNQSLTQIAGDLQYGKVSTSQAAQQLVSAGQQAVSASS